MDDHADLITRLRRKADNQPNKIERASCLETEAADALEAQAREIESLRSYIVDMDSEHD